MINGALIFHMNLSHISPFRSEFCVQKIILPISVNEQHNYHFKIHTILWENYNLSVIQQPISITLDWTRAQFDAEEIEF